MTSQWSTAAGLCLHVRVAGASGDADVPTVVLVHGLVASSRTFVPTLELLGNWSRALAPDLPGFGRSPSAGAVLDVAESAEVVHRWMAENGLEGATLVGHSLGASVVAHLAAGHPGSVSGLVLVSPALDRRLRHPLAPVVRWVRNAGREPLGAHAVLARDLLSCGPTTALRTYRYALEDRIEDQLARLASPMLVVRGDRDAVVSRPWAEELVTMVPGADLAVVRGAAHLLGYTSPSALDGLVADFVLT